MTSNSHAFNRVITHLRASNHLLSHENVIEPQTKDASHIRITLQRQIIDTNAPHIVTIPNGLLQNKKIINFYGPSDRLWIKYSLQSGEP